MKFDTIAAASFVAMAIAAACGDSDEADAGSADEAGDDGGGGEASGSAPSPGAEGWESAYAEESVGLDCGMSAADMMGSGAPALTFGDATIYVGYQQEGNNQNPIVARYDGQAQIYCIKHETEGPDGRAVGITWDGGDVAYLVYTIVGGGSSLESAASDGWLPAYAPGSINGGGPKVSYVGRLDTTDGALTTGTFVIAVKSGNEVNSHGPAGPVTVLEDGNVEFLGGSAHKPIDVDWMPMNCTDYPFDSRYVLAPDLGSVVCAECTNCESKQPCSS